MTLVVNATTTVATDQFDAASTAIRYGAADIQITIAPGVFVGTSGGTNAVFSIQNGSSLINNGNVVGGSNVGVQFGGDDIAIVNNGDIAGLGNGIVFVNGNGEAITNHGAVSGYQFAGISFGSGSENAVLNNDGEVYGHEQGVSSQTSVNGATINNSGLIHSDSIGVEVFSGAGLTTTVINAAGGTIEGDDAAIRTDQGRISLDNRGTIEGIIVCNASIGNVADVVINRGSITGQVFLGAGNDSFTGVGAATAGRVFGEAGSDKLTGGSSADLLDGGADNDTLTGGLGRDLLFGGISGDRFDFNTASESPAGANRDQILDFNKSQGDIIDLATIDAKTTVSGNNAFKLIGAADFHNVAGELRYEKKSGYVLVEADLNGNGTSDFEIKVVGVTSLGTGDFIL